MAQIKVGHANVKSKWHGIKVMRGEGCDVFGTSETNRLHKYAMRMNRWDPFFGGDHHTDRRKHDTAVFAQRKHENVGVLGFRIADDSYPEKVAGLPRFASAQFLDIPGMGVIGFWELHLHWIGPARTRPRVGRVQATHRGMQDFKEILDGFESANVRNIVVGDFNTRRGHKTPGWDDAWDVLHKLGFTTRQHGIDGIGISPHLKYAGKLDIIEKDRLRSDHDGFTVNVRG